MERHEAIAEQMASIRQAAQAAGRALSEDERAHLNELSVERATAYRAWQAERARTVPSNIIAGADIFRAATRRQQWKRWAIALAAVIILFGLRYQRYENRRSADDTYAYTAPSYLSDVDDGFSDDEQELLALLPPASVVPAGFTIGDEWGETLDDLAWERDESDERRLQLISWGFESAVYRYYELPENRLSEGSDGLYDLSVELIEYGSREQAIEASEADHAWTLDEWSDDGQMRLIDVETTIGDHAIALQEPYNSYGAELNWVQLWVVDGPLQYHYWALVDDAGLPPALLEIAEQTVALE